MDLIKNDIALLYAVRIAPYCSHQQTLLESTSRHQEEVLIKSRCVYYEQAALKVTHKNRQIW